MAESTSAEQAAYQASFKKAKKQQARDKGAADAGGAADALERARQRALAPQQPAALNSRAGATVQPTKPSGRFIDTPEGRVPEEFYSLTPEQQKQFRALVKGEENNAAGESQFDRVALALLDQQAAQAKRVTQLERLVQSLVGENMELRHRQDGIDTTIEVQQSDELTEQQTLLAQMTVNLQAVGAEQESNHQRRIAESAQQAADHEARLAAMEMAEAKSPRER